MGRGRNPLNMMAVHAHPKSTPGPLKKATNVFLVGRGPADIFRGYFTRWPPLTRKVRTGSAQNAGDRISGNMCGSACAIMKGPSERPNPSGGGVRTSPRRDFRTERSRLPRRHRTRSGRRGEH